MADSVGQRLGNYRLVRLLGQGGFAQVYLGEHLRLGTQAAIKLLSTHLPGLPASDNDHATETRNLVISHNAHARATFLLFFPHAGRKQTSTATRW